MFLSLSEKRDIFKIYTIQNTFIMLKISVWSDSLLHLKNTICLPWEGMCIRVEFVGWQSETFSVKKAEDRLHYTLHLGTDLSYECCSDRTGKNGWKVEACGIKSSNVTGCDQNVFGSLHSQHSSYPKG